MSRPDPGLIGAWLAARSLSRGLPAPVEDRGGLRVDTGLPGEKRRYIFLHDCPGLRALGAEIVEPLVMLKLAGGHAELAALLPPRWDLDPLAHVMTHDGAFGGTAPAAPPSGYRLEVDRDALCAKAQLMAEDGAIAASGHAAELGGVFIYDRIVTDPSHRRRGLGRTLMLALERTRRSPASRQVLTATADGRALYATLGWEVHAPWSTAVIRPAA